MTPDERNIMQKEYALFSDREKGSSDGEDPFCEVSLEKSIADSASERAEGKKATQKEVLKSKFHCEKASEVIRISLQGRSMCWRPRVRCLV